MGEFGPKTLHPTGPIMGQGVGGQEPRAVHLSPSKHTPQMLCFHKTWKLGVWGGGARMLGNETTNWLVTPPRLVHKYVEEHFTCMEAGRKAAALGVGQTWTQALALPVLTV